MRWSFKLCRAMGVDIYVHWTFLLLIGGIALVILIQGDGLRAAIAGVALVLTVFACVVLHELGHAVMARRFGIMTRDITLFPIGGVARLERMPEEPRQELLVALAGPAVNVAIALMLFTAIRLTGGDLSAETFQWTDGRFFVNVMWINVSLVAFNLLPAFPMDGGRVLRAMLATQFEYVRATQMAANIGQGMAVALGVFGFLSMNFILMLIAFFVYFGAGQEAQMTYAHALMRGASVRDAMLTRFHALRHDEPLQVATTEILAGNQQNFPVIMGDGNFGVLLHGEVMDAVACGRDDATIGEVARRDWAPVDDSAPLEQTFQRMNEEQIAMLPVVRQGEIVGILTLNHLSQWLSMRAALNAGNEKNRVERYLKHV